MNRFASGALVVFVLGSSGSVHAAPITFNTALPVAKGGTILKGQALLQGFETDRSPADRDLDVRGLLSVVGYGITPRLAAFAALPYLNKSMKVNVGGNRIKRSSAGFGDLKLFGRYTLYQHDARRQTFRLGAFGGIKAPTGDDSQTDSLGPLPIPLQSGTGAWDVFGGIVATYQKSEFQVDAQLSAEHNGTANDFKRGDALRADFSFQYRLLPRVLSADTQGFLYGVLEVTAINRKKNQVAKMSDPNSGGTTLFLTPGIQYVTRKFILESALQLPIRQDLHGTALRTDYVFSAGFRINF